MNNLSLDRSEFFERLHNVLRPSSPIDSVENLLGREKELMSLESALYAHGRHAFVIGDRGVGKSSLAQTAAHMIQSSDNTPIIVTCDHNSTLSSVVLSVLDIALSNLKLNESQSKITVSLPFLSYEFSNSHSNKPELPKEINISNAVQALAGLSQWHSKKPVIVIDEFDLVPESERTDFGVLIKQLGDQHINVKLIFTGIADSLNDLMSGHLSSSRQIHQVKLETLNWTARREIINTAFEAFDVSIPEDISYRIEGLSDGFPSYIHLLCEKILIEAYLSRESFEGVTFPLFIRALDEAILSVSETLRASYDKATEGKPDHMHHILWAMADSSDLQRKTEHVEFSYQSIMKQLRVPPLESDKFKKEFAKLRKSTHGEVVKKAFESRVGWYAFSENVIRGFIRMCAEKNKVDLDFERAYSPITATARPTGPRSSYQPLNQVERDVDQMRKKY